MSEQHKQEFPIVVMCHVLEVWESGFYAWRKRPVCQRQREDAQLSSHMRQIFVSHREVSGSRRMHAHLAEQGDRGSRKRIARLMRENGITASRKRRRVVTTNSRHENPVAPNLLQRDVTAQAPHSKWATDITSIPTAQGWLDLAVVLDVYSRLVVGWSMAAHGDEELLANALGMALARASVPRRDGCITARAAASMVAEGISTSWSSLR